MRNEERIIINMLRNMSYCHRQHKLVNQCIFIQAGLLLEFSGLLRTN